MRKNNKVKKLSKLDKLFEMPIEVITNDTKITIIGFNEMLIENYKGILEYEDFFIRINSNSGIININGFNLHLNQMTEDDIVVSGRIESLDFESIEE